MSPCKTTKKSPTKPSETVEHYNAILLEDIKSKMELVIEGMQTVETRLTCRMDGMETRLMGEIDMLKLAVTVHSGEIKELRSEVKDIRSEVKDIRSEVKDIKFEMQAVETRLSDKIDKWDTRWDDHEDRITALEKPASS